MLLSIKKISTHAKVLYKPVLNLKAESDADTQRVLCLKPSIMIGLEIIR